MRIIAKSTLKKFLGNPAYRDAEPSLKAWYKEASKAVWKNPHDVKAQFGSVSILANNRLVFNIGGNHYRLIVAANYR